MDAQEPGQDQAGQDDNLADDAVFFGPIWSTSTPLTKRRKAPANRGTATMNPFCAGFRCRSLEIATPSGPRITQTMKLRSK
jgi:hypothetical protein